MLQGFRAFSSLSYALSENLHTSEEIAMAIQNPLFYQFEVRPTVENPHVDTLAGALATVIVFAEIEEIGRARSSRYIARHHWEIVEVKRGFRMGVRQITDLQPHFRALYRQAEQFGIAARFDGWTRHEHHMSPPR